MASLTQWTWVWVNSRSWWWTGRPGVLWFMGSQRVRHDWATALNWTFYNSCCVVSGDLATIPAAHGWGQFWGNGAKLKSWQTASAFPHPQEEIRGPPSTSRLRVWVAVPFSPGWHQGWTAHPARKQPRVARDVSGASQPHCSPVLRPSRLSAHPWSSRSSFRGSEEPPRALAGLAAFLTPGAGVQASRHAVLREVTCWSAHQCLLLCWRLTFVPDWWAGETGRHQMTQHQWTLVTFPSPFSLPLLCRASRKLLPLGSSSYALIHPWDLRSCVLLLELESVERCLQSGRDLPSSLVSSRSLLIFQRPSASFQPFCLDFHLMI